MEELLLPKRILVIYTGGTIGMMQPPNKQYLQPVDFQNIRYFLPEIDRLGCEIEFLSFGDPIDSSNMAPEVWVELAQTIDTKYHEFDGFVVLHGTDTMSYTASVLSFMLEGLNKPVILTGSQLPVAVIRTDARENFITALEIAAHQLYRLSEVAIYFDSRLLRGNRTIKYSSEKFQAFISPLCPPLAEAGVDLEFFTYNWHKPGPDVVFKAQTKLSPAVGLIQFYPGIPPVLVQSILEMPSLKAIVLETYGAGSLPDFPWLIDAIKGCVDSGKIVVNVSQCAAGKVAQERYKNSNMLLEVGVLSGKDMTVSAALTKLMYLLDKYENDMSSIREWFGRNLSGEMLES